MAEIDVLDRTLAGAGLVPTDDELRKLVERGQIELLTEVAAAALAAELQTPVGGMQARNRKQVIPSSRDGSIREVKEDLVIDIGHTPGIDPGYCRGDFVVNGQSRPLSEDVITRAGAVAMAQPVQTEYLYTELFLG